MKNYPKYAKKLEYNPARNTLVYLSILDKLRLVKAKRKNYYKKALTQLDKIAPLIRKFVRKNTEAEVVLYWLWVKHRQNITRQWQIQTLALIGEMLDIWFIEDRVILEDDTKPYRTYYAIGPKYSVIIGIKLFRYILNTYEVSTQGMLREVRNKNVLNRAKRRRGKKHGKIVSIKEICSKHRKSVLVNLSAKMLELLQISKEYGARPSYKAEMTRLAKKHIKLNYKGHKSLTPDSEPSINLAMGSGLKRILKYDHNKFKRAFPRS